MTPGGRNHYEDWDLFALGALDEEQNREMEEHLASGCAACQQELQAAQAIVGGLATLSPEEQLPAGAEMRMRKRLGVTGERLPPAPVQAASAGQRWNAWQVAPWALAAACLVLAIGLGVRSRRSESELREQARQNAAEESRLQQQLSVAAESSEKKSADRVTELQATIEGLRQQLKAVQSAKLAADQELAAAKVEIAKVQERLQEADSSLKDAEARRTKGEEALSQARLQLVKAQADSSRLAAVSAQNDQIVALLESSALSQLDLKPMGSLQAAARVFWEDDRGLLLVARGLPSLPQNGSYQLWFYRKGTPSVVNVGVLQLQRAGTGLLFVPPGPALLAMTGALVTEESAPGSVASPGQEILKVKP